eukprot:3187426-Pleurochrysis_carterae.AAC.1
MLTFRRDRYNSESQLGVNILNAFSDIPTTYAAVRPSPCDAWMDTIRVAFSDLLRSIGLPASERCKIASHGRSTGRVAVPE